MANHWWSMSPIEMSIAVRKDEDYVDANGSLKNFSKEKWRASCKWQREKRARQEKAIVKLGESVAISQGTEPPDQLQTDETYYEDDQDQGVDTLTYVYEDDQDKGTDNIVNMVSQIQVKYEGMQKELDEKDEVHEEEKQRMRETHEQDMERLKQALGKYVVIICSYMFTYCYMYLKCTKLNHACSCISYYLRGGMTLVFFASHFSMAVNGLESCTVV